MHRPLSRRGFLKGSAAGALGLALAATDLTFRDLRAAEARQPRKLAHVLSDETYSLRDRIGSGELSLLTAAAFHKKLDIKGVSLNDLYFKSWDRDYLDQILASFKANDRVITCLIMEGNLANGNKAAR